MAEEQAKVVEVAEVVEEKTGSVAEAPAPEDTTRLHPLQCRWQLWFNAPPKKGVWDTKKIMAFGTVEDFWRLYNNIARPSELQIGSNYHLFKEGVAPSWEDPANVKGGKWVVNLPRNKRGGGMEGLVDAAWQWTLLALIGELFDVDSEDICGIVISPRKTQNRLALWTRDAWNEEVCQRIGKSFKTQLLLHLKAEASLGKFSDVPDIDLGYQVHKDAMTHGTSFRNSNKYKC